MTATVITTARRGNQNPRSHNNPESKVKLGAYTRVLVWMKNTRIGDTKVGSLVVEWLNWIGNIFRSIKGKRQISFGELKDKATLLKNRDIGQKAIKKHQKTAKIIKEKHFANSEATVAETIGGHSSNRPVSISMLSKTMQSLYAKLDDKEKEIINKEMSQGKSISEIEGWIELYAYEFANQQ